LRLANPDRPRNHRERLAFDTEDPIMGLLSFIREAGEKLFGHKEVDEAQEAAAQNEDEDVQARVAQLNATAGQAIMEYIASQNLSAEGLSVAFDGATRTATVFGQAPDQTTREKIVLCCGNVQGVEAVDDRMTAAQSEPEATFYTVVRGDTLSKIAKEQYGSANKYPQIFEANRPMLTHPDKIYPGQVLRIPPQ
jgi:nucleoid-associated protein YgaU